jgi:hypothetical protein
MLSQILLQKSDSLWNVTQRNFDSEILGVLDLSIEKLSLKGERQKGLVISIVQSPRICA